MLVAQIALALSRGQALEWGLWAVCCKLLGGSMGQLVIRVEVVRMAPTQQSQALTDFHHVGLCGISMQHYLSLSNGAA